MAEKSGLEADVILRTAHGDANAQPQRVEIIGIKVEPQNRYYLTICESAAAVGGTTCELLLSNYYIIQLLWTPDEVIGVVDQDFAVEQAAQDEAYEMIEQILADEEGFGRLEDKGKTNVIPSIVNESSPSGPRRVEISLSRIASPKEEFRVVVTGLQPPQGRFLNLTAAGRLWKYPKRTLNMTVEHFTSQGHYIKHLSFFSGGSAGTSSTSFFSVSDEDQRKGWTQLETAYYRLQPAELAVLRNWSPETISSTVGDDLDDDLESYYSKVPSSYRNVTKHVAFYRVRGDEIGVSISKERAKDKPRTLDELQALERRLVKKPTPLPALPGSANVRVSPCDCQSPRCEECWERGIDKTRSSRSRWLH